MPTHNVVIESQLSRSTRVRQLESMFDVPAQEKCRLEWNIEMPSLTEMDWNVGLIVGPSGSGKSTIANHLFPEQMARTYEWNGKSVIDDFPAEFTLQQIAEICQSVGFNTIPAWMRPYSVLSNGEKFRVEIARRLLENTSLMAVDEFTSVVDRQVATIVSHCVQKYVRKHAKKFVAVSCHYDIIEWLQPDWIIDASTGKFERRLLRRRPQLEGSIRRVSRAAWSLFAPYHYMSADLHPGAQCWCLYVGDQPAAFTGILHRPIGGATPVKNNIKACSRLVTLPDFQGLGLAFRLNETIGAAYKTLGFRFRNYPAHPLFIQSYVKNPNWIMVKKPGYVSVGKQKTGLSEPMGMRPCAVFEYSGPALDVTTAQRIIHG